MNVLEIAGKHDIGDVAQLREMLEQIRPAYELATSVDFWIKGDRKTAISETKKVAKSAERLIATLNNLSEETRGTMNFLASCGTLGRTFERPDDHSTAYSGIPDYVELLADAVSTIQTIDRDIMATFDKAEGRPSYSALRVIANVVQPYWVEELGLPWTVTFHRAFKEVDETVPIRL